MPTTEKKEATLGRLSLQNRSQLEKPVAKNLKGLKFFKVNEPIGIDERLPEKKEKLMSLGGGFSTQDKNHLEKFLQLLIAAPPNHSRKLQRKLSQEQRN